LKLDPFDQNLVLARLDQSERERLSPSISEVSLKLGQHIQSVATRSDKMYFPLSGIVSLVLFMEDGRTGEIAIIGREGLVGSDIYLSGKTSTAEAVVQVAASALVLPRKAALAEFDRKGNFYRVLLEYSQALMAQIAHVALCNRHHRVEQQLARWLLMSLDRLGSPHVSMTQDLIANMLGVRREGVSVAAHSLQEAGIIEYQRGKIRVLNREALLAHSCECYEAILDVYKRIGIG
tara:strand:- start:22006 stop:22710 length:705 start_codon:yes stop_codon:yes gene_type:complete